MLIQFKGSPRAFHIPLGSLTALGLALNYVTHPETCLRVDLVLEAGRGAVSEGTGLSSDVKEDCRLQTSVPLPSQNQGIPV